MKIVIVGGGAAGLFAAINIKNNTNEVIILEKNDEVGKKILVTGNGRCNLWNEDMNISRYNSSNKELLDSFINDEIIIKTFTELSKYYEYKNKNGYLYPYSNKAATVRDILLSECNKKGVFHCCPLNVDLVREGLKLGFYISFAGPCTFKNSKNANEIIKMVPNDRMLIETDSPYLSPEPLRGKRNDSRNLKYIVGKIAEVKGVSPEEIAKITYNNAKKIFS